MRLFSACRHCGRRNHKMRECRHRTKVCNGCGRRGHIIDVCNLISSTRPQPQIFSGASAKEGSQVITPEAPAVLSLYSLLSLSSSPSSQISPGTDASAGCTHVVQEDDTTKTETTNTNATTTTSRTHVTQPHVYMQNSRIASQGRPSSSSSPLLSSRMEQA